MDYKKSLEELEKLLEELREENKTVPIIVEGEKDVEALRSLDITGLIVIVNTGMSIPNFCDKIANEHKEVILLTDWDRRGGFLCHTISKNLEGRVKCNTNYREMFAKHTTIRTVEGLPSWLKTMKEKI
jgi:5S rRNA maturation endonuclease (ribonuclease M5)